MLRKVKYNSTPVAIRKSDEIAFSVSSAHVNAVNESIARKTKRNEIERIESYKAAKDFVAKEKISEAQDDIRPLTKKLIISDDKENLY